MYISHIFCLIHPSADGYLGCFHILVIVNSASMNFGVHVLFWNTVFIFFGYIAHSGIVRLNCSSIFSFLRNKPCFLYMWIDMQIKIWEWEHIEVWWHVVVRALGLSCVARVSVDQYNPTEGSLVIVNRSVNSHSLLPSFMSSENLCCRDTSEMTCVQDESLLLHGLWQTTRNKAKSPSRKT